MCTTLNCLVFFVARKLFQRWILLDSLTFHTLSKQGKATAQFKHDFFFSHLLFAGKNLVAQCVAFTGVI